MLGGKHSNWPSAPAELAEVGSPTVFSVSVSLFLSPPPPPSPDCSPKGPPAVRGPACRLAPRLRRKQTVKHFVCKTLVMFSGRTNIYLQIRHHTPPPAGAPGVGSG